MRRTVSSKSSGAGATRRRCGAAPAAGAGNGSASAGGSSSIEDIGPSSSRGAGFADYPHQRRTSRNLSGLLQDFFDRYVTVQTGQLLKVARMTCREPPCRVISTLSKGASTVEHVVFFPAHDGSPAFRRVANLEDAVRLVEHLRNIEGVNEVSCHALTEVPLAFRAYYRVEVPAGAEPSVPEQPVAEEAGEAPVLADAVAAPQAEAELPTSEPVMAAANGRATDGAKSLGFFA